MFVRRIPGRSRRFESRFAAARTRSLRRRHPAHDAFLDVALRAASILSLVLVWWVLSLFFPPTLIPNPWDTFAEVGAIIRSGELATEMGATLRRVGVGFAIA